MMNPKTSIVVPLDGSPTAAKALGAAQALAKGMNATLHIVHVSESASQHLLVEELDLSGLEVEDYAVHRLTGEVVDSIIDFALRVEARMIVMSSHGWTFNPEHLMGSTSLDIIQRTSQPVMVIRPDMKVLPTPKWHPTKMLVPLNGSPVAAAAMDQVFDLAQVMACDVDVVHIAVVGQKPPKEAGTLATSHYLDYPQHEWPAWAREFIERFARRPSSVKLKLHHRGGVPANEILKLAQESGHDMIILTWRGLLEKGRAKTIKRILRKTELPVLLIKTG